MTNENNIISPNSKSMLQHDRTLKTEISVSDIAKVDNDSTNPFGESIPAIRVTDQTLSPTLKISSTESLTNSAKSSIGDEEILYATSTLIEETEEMLDVISFAKEKLAFFISRVEDLVKSLHEISRLSAANTYIQNLYLKKLEEFAQSVLEKVKKSTEDLDADNELLKEHKKKVTETFEKATELHRNSNLWATKIKEKSLLKETVVQLDEEICLLIPKQLSEINKVTRIEADIEMLYDLLQRFSTQF